MTTYYEILGVAQTASSEEIKKAYRRQSLTYHPDRNRSDPSATAQFQSIGKAYAVLGDKDRRRSYDMTIQAETRPEKHSYDMFTKTNHYYVHPMKPPSIEVNLEITLTQAYTGCTESVSVKRWITENGSGQREERETLYVAIPRGADDGEIILIEGKGHCSPEGFRVM